IAVLILKPSLFGLRPTVPDPRRPIDDDSAAPISFALAEAWEPSENVPWNIVLPLARISEATYGEGEELKATLGKWGLDRFNELRHGTMYACVASNEQAVVIAFRGTDEIRDWLINARVLSDPVEHGSIHRGFFRSMTAMRDPILDLVHQHCGENKPVWIV